jgi:hypothetical protein
MYALPYALPCCAVINFNLQHFATLKSFIPLSKRWIADKFYKIFLIEKHPKNIMEKLHNGLLEHATLPYRKPYIKTRSILKMSLTPEQAKTIKAIIEEELTRDFDQKRLHPYSRLKHLTGIIFYKIDNLDVKP